MRDCTEIFSESGEHIATIGFNESYGLWQIAVVQREEMEFFCPSKEVAFAAWQEACPNRAFLIRLEIGRMRDSLMKSFVSEIKGFIRFGSLTRPGGSYALDYFRCFAAFVAVGF
jgi:hypothetical protein